MKAFNKPERAAELGLKIIQAGEQSIIMKDIATLDENQSIDDFMNQLKREDIRLVESEPNSYNHIKNTLALAYMQYLDNIRYESKMCLSNGECMDIERAFEEQD